MSNKADSLRKALAQTHVSRGRAVVIRQRGIIANIRHCNGDTKDAVALLQLFEETLALFEEDLAAIEDGQR